MNTELGKLFIFLGGILVVAGLLLVFKPPIPFLGKLPGDIYIKRENFQFYFPFTTCLMLSLLLTLILYLVKK